MHVLPAMEATMKLADPRRMPVEGALSHAHLADMLARARAKDMSYGKLCRWLGWMQCAVAASGCATLEDMKQINMTNKD